MKISEDDLNQIFKKDNKNNRDKITGDPVRIIKQKEKFDHINSVRKKITKIKEHHKARNYFGEMSTFLLRTLFIWGIVCFLGLLLFNFSSIFNRIKWTYYIDYLNQKLPEENKNNLPKITDDKINLPGNLPNISSISNNRLIISKISIDAPIIWDVEPDLILDKLKDGVVQYQGTGHPGKGENTFIIGHSSNYFWINSDYNSVFSLLDKLENGDRIEISYNNKQYFYDVVDKRVVGQDQVEFLKSTPKETLTLMTCWPVGTSLNRIIIQSELIYSSY